MKFGVVDGVDLVVVVRVCSSDMPHTLPGEMPPPPLTLATGI